MEFKFNVGEGETHEIRVSYERKLANKISIEVDGNEVEQERFRFYLPRSRRYQFRVGDGEQHDVTVETSLPRFARALSDPVFRVSVDGNFLRQYKGIM